MLHIRNRITLSRLNKLHLFAPTGANQTNPLNTIKDLLLDIMQFGYTLDTDICHIISRFHQHDIMEFHENLVNELKVIKGDFFTYQPLFSSFPDVHNDYVSQSYITQTFETYNISSKDYMIYDCGHVVSGSDSGSLCPCCASNSSTETNQTPVALNELTPLKVITLCDLEASTTILKNLITSNVVISNDDREMLTEFYNSDFVAFINIIDGDIPMKENIAFLAALLLTESKGTSYINFFIKQYIKTATDVLRFACALCDGDVTLKNPTKFKFNNYKRRLILEALNNVNPETIIEDMFRWKMRWIRLGEVIHPGKYKKRWPRAFKGFDEIRNNSNKFKSFNYYTELGINNKLYEVLDHLQLRPGEFGRNLDRLLRTLDTSKVLGAFSKIVNDIPTTMLLQMETHFANSIEEKSHRHFLIKGDTCNFYKKNEIIKPHSKQLVVSVIAIIGKEFNNRFSKRYCLGKVYLDPKLSRYIVPFGQRNTNKQLVTITKGSRVPLDKNASTIRAFTYWKENKLSGRVDLDLSVILYDTDFQFINQCSYTKTSTYGLTHSGDITTAPDGASEFLDIDIKKCKERNVRYVVMSLLSYNGTPFDEYTAFAGVMSRVDKWKGKNFDPRTVSQCFDLSGNSKVNIPIVLDLDTMEYIWCDFDLKVGASNYHNTENNKKGLAIYTEIAADLINTKPNLGQLFWHHCNARAEILDLEFNSEVEYDLILDCDYVTKIDDIMANWLA